jgi:hypothetical protein
VGPAVEGDDGRRSNVREKPGIFKLVCTKIR